MNNLEDYKNLLLEAYVFISMEHKALSPWRKALKHWQERVEALTGFDANTEIFLYKQPGTLPDEVKDAMLGFKLDIGTDGTVQYVKELSDGTYGCRFSHQGWFPIFLNESKDDYDITKKFKSPWDAAQESLKIFT